MKKPNHIVYYCMALKKTGKPIIVFDIDKKKSKNTNRVAFNNVNIRMVFNNATGKAKRSGATTILEVYKK